MGEEKVIISILVAYVGVVAGVFGLSGWLDKKANEKQRIADEKQRKHINEMVEANEKQIIAYEKYKQKWEEERNRLLSKIITSSNNSIRGYKVLRHILMVSITDQDNKNIAEGMFLLAVEEAGGNGVINMQVRPHRGGYFSVQGDAVLIELG
jgi:hypothetical protein